jgi:flagellar basal-body rod protein FlgG
MIDSLYIGATGMHAQQMGIDVISNNLANVNTNGFKKSRVDFEDLLYRDTIRANGLVGNPDNVHRLGMGAAVAGTGKVFTAGDIKKTDDPLDLAIQGQGFFEVVLPTGELGYTRSGAFEINRDGMLSTADGYQLSGSLQVPVDATGIVVEANGHVLANVVGESRPVEIGHLEIANFPNPGGLTPLGDNLYLPTQKSGDPIRGIPGEIGLGFVAQGFLEASNVKLVEEMISLILAQRAYEINSKVVQASDEIMSITNSLYR